MLQALTSSFYIFVSLEPVWPLQPLAPWLSRLSSLTHHHRGPIVLVDAAGWGARALIEHLTDSQPTLWIELTPSCVDSSNQQRQAILQATTALYGPTFLDQETLEVLLHELSIRLSFLPHNALVLKHPKYPPQLGSSAILEDPHRGLQRDITQLSYLAPASMLEPPLSGSQR